MVDVLVYIVILLVILNVISFLAFFRDKGAAKRSTWRTRRGGFSSSRCSDRLALTGRCGASGTRRGRRSSGSSPSSSALQIALFAVLILAFVGLIS